MISKKIKENHEISKQGVSTYIPHPPELGLFTKMFPGRLRGDITCITGGTSSAKTSVCKMLVFKAIEWAIAKNKDYKVLWFGLEESEDQFDYSLFSYLLFLRTKGEVRYNIEHFENLGKTVDPKDFPLIDQTEEMFAKYKSHIVFYENITNSFGIYKEIRKFARSRGKFWFRGKVLTDAELDAGNQWSKYTPDNPDEFIEVVVDHLSELVQQQNEKDIRDSMINLVKNLRLYVAKLFKYSVIPIQQQALEMENLDHIKEKQVYASIQGLGDAKVTARAYLNIIGITNLNKYDIPLASAEGGPYNIKAFGDYHRVLSILKRRYGVSNKRFLTYFDGCVGWFRGLDKSNLEHYKTVAGKFIEKEKDIC